MEVPEIAGLVGVDEDEVESTGEALQGVECGADLNGDARTRDRLGEALPGDVGHVGVHLACHHLPVRGDRFGHGERRVPREHTDVENSTSSRDVYEELQQLAFDMPGQHFLLQGPRPGHRFVLVPSHLSRPFGKRCQLRRLRGCALTEVRVQSGSEISGLAQPCLESRVQIWGAVEQSGQFRQLGREDRRRRDGPWNGGHGLSHRCRPVAHR